MSINLESKKEVKELIQSLGDKSRNMESPTGNLVVISKNELDGLEIRTHQDNGWIRINYYGADGSYEGESYDGKWK